MSSFRLRDGRSRRRVLIIVQNLPVPFDRRVWLEACALRDAGFQVSVVCPKGPGDPSFEELEGIRICKYRSAAADERRAVVRMGIRVLLGPHAGPRCASRPEKVRRDPGVLTRPTPTGRSLLRSSPSANASSSTSTTSARRSTSHASRTDHGASPGAELLERALTRSPITS